jgi:NADH:ubiquinone oxidoreductase subunit F (NADH-binding)
MIVMNEHTNMVEALRNIVRFYAHESCGQCTPCREGSAWMNKILNRIVGGGGRAKDIDMLLELEKTMGIMPGRRYGVGYADVHQQVLRRIRRRLPRTDGVRGRVDQAREYERGRADGEQYAVGGSVSER